MKELSIKSLILEEISKRKDVYQKSPADMVSAFNREVETEKEYNGRQLLELLQNADDEQSKDVRIELDTVNNILIISNKGESESCTPFSAKGIRSLMISNLSTKTSKKYIGNKGLGFRSIINWSETISINSKGLNIEFSNEIVNQVFDELFTPEERADIRAEQKLPESVYPIPFLSIPKVSEKANDNWVTSIKINYKPRFLKDIKQQINGLKNEILLFLNSIETLEIYVDDEPVKSIHKSNLAKKWTVFEKNERLPSEYWDKENEEEFYDLKIALQDDLSCDIKELFAYFPTKLIIDLPFIVHGTFELNSSRNEINNSPKNQFILEKLVELIISTAKKLTKTSVNFKALEMLSYSNPNNVLFELGFYNAIDEAIEHLDIFPCLDGRYRRKSEVLFLNELSVFVQDVKKEYLFKNLIIPSDGSIDITTFDVKNSISTKPLTELSKSITCLKERASLIFMFHNSFKHETKLEFLVDSNSDVISLDDDVYTPSTQKFSLPDYVNIKFMHKELFAQLIIKFGIESSDKTRELQKLLNEITNIQQYQPVPVIQKIISSTNKLLTDNPSTNAELIRKMVLSLYENYLKLDKTQIPSGTKVQLLNKSGLISEAKDLYLSNSYPSGKLTEFLFEGILNDTNYLSDFHSLSFTDQDLESVEQFFLWLGVNKYTKFIMHKDIQNYNYRDFVFEHRKKPINYRGNSLSYTEISKFTEIVEKITLEKLVIWFCLDPLIQKQLDHYSNDDVFKYSKVGESTTSYYHILNANPSFITYQVKSKGLFNDFFVGNANWSPLINELDFDFEYKAFEKYDLNRPSIESALIKLGAVDKFEKLSIDSVNRIVNSLAKKAPDGKQTQTIYKLCIKHFEKNATILDTSKTLLFATKDDKKRYFPAKEVFYNGNIRLPKKITSTKAIFNYPRRQSTPKIIELFGINNLSSLEIKIENKTILKTLNEDFSIFLENITQYILVYRVQNIEKDKEAKDELAKLKNISINICDHVRYTIDNDTFELDNNDYVRDGKSYFIKVDKYSSLNDLRHNFEFQECFADIIGLVFDIQETKVFRDMVKEDDTYIEQTIRNDIGGDELVRTRELLGISDEKHSFWKTIYTLIGKEYEFVTDEHLLINVADDLKIKSDITGIDYLNLNSLESCNSIVRLFQELKVDITLFNKCSHSYYKIDFSKFHKTNLKQAFESNLYDFKKKLYSWCINESEEKKFTRYINNYEYNDDFIQLVSQENKFILIVDYSQNVQQFISDKFSLGGIKATEIDFLSVYQQNEKIIKIDCLEGDAEYLSLLYFSHKTKEITDYIDSNTAKEQEAKGERENSAKKNDKPIKKANEATLGKPKPASSARFKGKKPYKHSSSSDNRKKEIGNDSEEDVYAYLVNEYGKNKVTWISKDDDGYGCDIKYINKDGVTKYVEVKTLSGSKFHISKNEIEFYKENIEHYEIFLVGDKINIIKNIDFDDKEKFRVDGKEFIVTYNIL
ncbi:DUF3883 domain-containing protein [Aliivibrio sifiae]|uniref:Protein NO VEIN C-terminal domain-containing protein n=1 Tax=Aliivibrio sifiae TaxID=566293 RepID=A0A2S7X774_9GAMM|nr:DUF3883 domain-containing protein [Aliivibrio sifiae]PQJ87208.1 hypothetical protein BTO23_13860 [Aliivibrio sifiae]GLR73650.1 hypothetical protein GCM10007855_05240 [Aliivibrio sifiae]